MRVQSPPFLLIVLMKTKATLLQDCPTGLARNENNECIPTRPFIGRTGTIIEIEDDAYNTDRPTGDEPCYYLIDFGDQKLWIPSSVFMGDDENGVERWERFL